MNKIPRGVQHVPRAFRHAAQKVGGRYPRPSHTSPHCHARSDRVRIDRPITPTKRFRIPQVCDVRGVVRRRPVRQLHAPRRAPICRHECGFAAARGARNEGENALWKSNVDVFKIVCRCTADGQNRPRRADVKTRDMHPKERARCLDVVSVQAIRSEAQKAIWPPAGPAPGPSSTTRSHAAITCASCSITTTALPARASSVSAEIRGGTSDG